MTPTATPPIAIRVMSEARRELAPAPQVAHGDPPLERLGPSERPPESARSGSGPSSTLRPHGRKEDHVADRGLIGEEHEQPVDPDADAAGRRHAVLQRAE